MRFRMPYVRVWIHLVWSTKCWKKLIAPEYRQRIFDHIRCHARQKGIFLDSLNGVEDHVHVLISLGSEQSIATVVRLLKGEASHWINKQGWATERFEWQEEYFAISVSESAVRKVRAYIQNQEGHHRKNETVRKP